MSEYQHLQLISPKEFKEKYAPTMGVPAVRNLFYREDFPSVKVGDRQYTTAAAAEKWLSRLGQGGE